MNIYKLKSKKRGTIKELISFDARKEFLVTYRYEEDGIQKYRIEGIENGYYALGKNNSSDLWKNEFLGIDMVEDRFVTETVEGNVQIYDLFGNCLLTNSGRLMTIPSYFPITIECKSHFEVYNRNGAMISYPLDFWDIYFPLEHEGPWEYHSLVTKRFMVKKEYFFNQDTSHQDIKDASHAKRKWDKLYRQKHFVKVMENYIEHWYREKNIPIQVEMEETKSDEYFNIIMNMPDTYWEKRLDTYRVINFYTYFRNKNTRILAIDSNGDSRYALMADYFLTPPRVCKHIKKLSEDSECFLVQTIWDDYNRFLCLEEESAWKTIGKKLPAELQFKDMIQKDVIQKEDGYCISVYRVGEKYLMPYRKEVFDHVEVVTATETGQLFLLYSKENGDSYLVE